MTELGGSHHPSPPGAGRQSVGSRSRGRTVARTLIVVGPAFVAGWVVSSLGFVPEAVGTWWVDDGASIVGAFMVSPGFGGLAAVGAATIAYQAALRSSRGAREQSTFDRVQRDRAERKAQWWARAEWALNLTVSGNTANATIGYRVLESLGESEWADEHEGDVIAAATSEALEGSVRESVTRRVFSRIRSRGQR